MRYFLLVMLVMLLGAFVVGCGGEDSVNPVQDLALEDSEHKPFEPNKIGDLEEIRNLLLELRDQDDEEATTTDGVTAYSKSFFAHQKNGTVLVVRRDTKRASALIISAQLTSPVIGYGQGVPVVDLVTEVSDERNFGSSIALFEGPVERGVRQDRPFVPMVGNPAALLAVGAPSVDGGAVYIFRVGPQGLWWESKIESKSPGFGSLVKFVVIDDRRYLLIDDGDRTIPTIPEFIPIGRFLSIG